MSLYTSEFTVVIPAYNEAATIRDVAARTLEYVAQVIVVDDGSSDNTAMACHDLPVTVLRHSHNLGKAAALWRGMQYAIEHEITAIITLDGDGQHEPEDIPALIAMHRKDPLAIVIGSRLHDARDIPMARYIANRVANFWISWASRQPIADSQSGFRVYPASVLSAVGSLCDRTAGFVFESEVLIEAGRKGIRIRSVPVSSVYGRHLRRSHFRQVRDITRITRMVGGKLLDRRLDLSGLVKSRKKQRPDSAHRRASIQLPERPNSPPRRRILFVAEAVSLAHVARAVSLAQTLDPARYEVHLACDPRYLALFDKISFPVHSIRTISSEAFRDRLIKGHPLYTVSDLREYAKQDLHLLATLNPDVVVGDFRLSLSVSARVAGIPYLSVTNAHWSPYARSHFVVPDIAISDRFGPRLGQALFSVFRPAIFAHHAFALNKIRHDYGLPSLGYDLLHVFTDADEALYADLPELVPTFDRPSHHHYLGPVLWSSDSIPSWWNELPTDRPLAYVSLGTSGRSEALTRVLQALATLGVGAMVSTAGKPPPASLPDRVWVSDYLPGIQAAERADFVVCNGGSATVYQALAAGVPVLGLPNNLDQYLMMDYVRKFAAGEYVRSGGASVEALTQVAAQILATASYRQQAESLRVSIRTQGSGERFVRVLESLLGRESADACSASATQHTGSRATLSTRDLDAQRRNRDVRHAPDMQY
ncbi:MAG: glycosyltransferase [Nitrospiraceae bacterium]